MRGSLKGIFDGPTTRPIDLDAPAVSVDISNVAAAGDTLVAAAMLSTWSHGFGMVDAAAALAEQGLAPQRNYFAVMDELWRALRGAPGLVEYADSLTRLNRAKGMGHIMITHSLADLEALPSAEDRAKAMGFAERCAITVLAGLSPRELARVNEIVPLSLAERQTVESWSAPESWQPGVRHPGRGKYLIKTGQRVGIPVEPECVGDEAELYNIDRAVRREGVPAPARRRHRGPGVTRALGPRVGLPSQGLLPFTVLILCWAPVLAAGLLWVAGQAAATLSGHGWTGPSFGFGYAEQLVREGPAGMWPGIPVALVWGVAALLVVLVAAPVTVVGWRRLGRRGDPSGPVPSLARAADLDALTPPGVVGRAVALRPSLRERDRKSLQPRDVGVQPGELLPRGSLLRASWEDVLVALMAPRTGKGPIGSRGRRPARPSAVAAGSTRRWSWSWTRRPTCAGSATYPTSTAIWAAAGSSR